jgi:hypothetical protein
MDSGYRIGWTMVQNYSTESVFIFEAFILTMHINSYTPNRFITFSGEAFA